MTRTNADRMASALRALRSYSPQTEGVETAMTDLVTDLRHLAASNEIDWDALVARAGRHFATEVYEERTYANPDWPQADRDPSH